MPALSKMYEADLVRRLIDNWARWPGWAGHTGTRSTLAWLDDFVSNKRQGDYAATVPVMGGEAADTHRALGRMSAELSEALVIYYTWRGTVSEKLIELAKKRPDRERMSKRTFFRRVSDAHPVFITEYRGARDTANLVSARNEAASGSASASVARRHRLVTPKIALKAPENDSDINTLPKVSENGQ